MGNDPLWDPGAHADPDLARIERLLSPYGARARALALPEAAAATPQAVTGAPTRGKRRWLLAASLLALTLLGVGFQYRLSWTANRGWPTELGATPRPSFELQPGGMLATARGTTAHVAVARIGRLTVSPESRLRLIETRSGRHRVALDVGHLRARIWAPPGYFGVLGVDSEIVDLGCDFDLWKRHDGSGLVAVRSGWVGFRVGDDDILVPEHYRLRFVGTQAATPLRFDAADTFVEAVRRLDSVLAEPGAKPASHAGAEAARVAALARDTDAFTLLSLLSRWPALAHTDLYPRLGKALAMQAGPQHRADWIAGDLQAINTWWRAYPTQPKNWWANWSDAFALELGDGPAPIE